jgi:hypothetical protein
MGRKYSRAGIPADQGKGEMMIRLNVDSERLLILIQVSAMGKAMLALASWQCAAKFSQNSWSAS